MAYSIPKVAILYDSSQALSRKLVQMLAHAAHAFGQFHIEPCDSRHGGASNLALLKTCQGIFADAESFRHLPFAKKIASVKKRPIILINSDASAFGRHAAEFFLARAPRTFAYVGMAESTNWDCARGEFFDARLREDRKRAHLYSSSQKFLASDEENKRLQKWLKSLKKPLAIFAANDARAWDVLKACESAGIDVPCEATILGVDNDEWICELARPRLSSMNFYAKESVSELVHEMSNLLQGAAREKRSARDFIREIKILPGEICERESTAERIVMQPVVKRALAFIEAKKGLVIRATDVAREVGVSQNWLERLFRQTVKTSLIAEIARVRMETTLHFVRETKLEPHEIAKICGFSNVSTLCRLVKKATGQTIRSLRQASEP